MPIELHRKLGPLMQKLCAGFSWRVSEKIGAARAQLEEWAIHEHNKYHADVVYDHYYGGPSIPVCNTDAERFEAISEARAIAEIGYQDCKPRRELIAALDAGIAEMASKV